LNTVVVFLVDSAGEGQCCKKYRFLRNERVIGVVRLAETVETVGGQVNGRHTLLKQGVNERRRSEGFFK
jgi:hypothetical protein